MAPDEVWLRGNPRPVIAGTAIAVAAALTLVAVAMRRAEPVVAWSLAALLVGVAVAGAILVRTAVGPRVGRRGDRLLVRLAPWRSEEVPLAVVECVFPGSAPLSGPVIEHVHVDPDAPAPPPPARRVGTLVIRFAERAAEWRERPTFAPWGVWHDGHAIIDGRWCEPLSADLARRIGARLVEAKREAAAGGGTT